MKLSSIQTKTENYCLIEIDNMPMILLDSGIDVGQEAGAQLYERIVEAGMVHLSKHASGVSVGPEVGLDFITDKTESAGTIIRLNHQTVAPDYQELPTMIQGWGVEHISNNYGVAKLDLWYNPDEPKTLDKKKLVAELHEYCRQSGIDFLLNLKVFLMSSDSRSFSEIQLESVQEISRYCDLISLEYPESALSAATISAEIDVPWILANGSTVGYEQFKQQLRECLESGARGCVVDQLLWSGLLDVVQDENELTVTTVQQFANVTGRDRVIELARIVEETLK